MSAPRPEIIERVKAAKQRRRSSASQYQDQPELALVVQSFNRISNIEQLVEGIRGLGDHELIVCEDGSLDGSHEKWMSYLDRPNDFLIHSNDLHEIRILDRAIRFARSEIVCIVQDDDVIPRDPYWLDAVLRRFADDPKLAIVGGFMGFDSFDPDPAQAKRIWGGDAFRYVVHVNIGPYFIRPRRTLSAGRRHRPVLERGQARQLRQELGDHLSHLRTLCRTHRWVGGCRERDPR